MTKGYKTGGVLKKPFEWIETESGCFECVSHKAKTTYKGHSSSVFRMDGKNVLLHRFIYTQMFGNIPKGFVVRHKCDNGLCINPEHLEIGTPKQNSEDMVKRGRNKNGPRKLKDSEVDEIRKYFKTKILSQKQIAEKYGVSPQTICDIKKGRTRKLR